MLKTDAHPALLYTAIIDLPDESEDIKIMPTQPVIRVEPGQTQQIRFILQNNTPLEVEHFKRVTFEGIPPKIMIKELKLVLIFARICQFLFALLTWLLLLMHGSIFNGQQKEMKGKSLIQVNMLCGWLVI
ncbi:putative fimbrial chaperone protein [Klebsiella michiganensis]|uniref:Putative fimbrial chaperone protein n=1 Tax=Klebsiella michiganensis TaxID=1134687 RepID=A0A7H4M598_9ENTR|nr:putative fimbrial chaperone protein [Klebsiella michiganensis]